LSETRFCWFTAGLAATCDASLPLPLNYHLNPSPHHRQFAGFRFSRLSPWPCLSQRHWDKVVRDRSPPAACCACVDEVLHKSVGSVVDFHPELCGFSFNTDASEVMSPDLSAKRSSHGHHMINKCPHTRCTLMKDLEYHDRLRKLKLWTLQERRNRAVLIELFKMVRGISCHLVCPECSECGVTSHSVEHLFNCQSNPMQLTPQDLWDDPAAVADFLNLDN